MTDITAHRISTRPSTSRVRVEHDGRVLADSTSAVELDEAGLPVRYYLPREDVLVDLTPTDTTTHCPFKGDATYFSAGGVEDAFWVYEAPAQEDAEPVAGLLSPWAGRVEVIVEDDDRTDADTLPGAPGRSDTPLGDTDQHSDVDA